MGALFRGGLMRAFLALPVAAILLTGCVTDDRQARLKPYIGGTMADFSRGTGLVPSASYDTAAGRTFVVNGPVVAVAVAPGAAVAGGCRMLVEATATAPRPTADDWRVVAIDATGPC